MWVVGASVLIRGIVCIMGAVCCVGSSIVRIVPVVVSVLLV